MHPNRLPSFHQRFHSESLGQSALRLICILSFSFLAFAVLIFVIITTTSHSETPLPYSSFTHITSFLASSSSSSSKSIIQPATDAIMQEASLPDYSNTTLDPSPDISLPSDQECDLNSPINCADPEVYHILMKATIEAFPDVHFHRFGKPVTGDDNGRSCDIAWRYRPKTARRPGIFKDYRRFDVSRSANCVYLVSKIGEYHTGLNARKKKSNVKMMNETNKQDSFLSEYQSESRFKSGKYLVYLGGGDRCKGMNHYLWSLFCSLGEARFLNRTLVMDLSICLSSMYSSWKQNEEGKDFRFYFDFEQLRASASVIDQRQFWTNWELWRKKNKLNVRLVEDYRITPSKLSRVKDTLILRKFGFVEPDNYWYRVCQRESKSLIRRPWHLLKRSPRLKDIALAIASKLDWDFDVVLILRPYKDDLLKTLREKIQDGRNVYIATDKSDTTVFDPLKDRYTIHFLDDYKELWGEKTEWFIETKNLNNGITVEFDGYMRKEVNTEVFFMGKKQIKWE
ncbi:hypothetical protein LUZ61_018291 [Rhynchospora tenuis]|uniref:Uncharacterized protein n=1 Tax=Rhynchospora tenuis TaxID=198213 RepID=A0AAD5Z907_9POAL|nr:hypothetical protein LUZ61_018291 [Rhynchospora tenuis]